MSEWAMEKEREFRKLFPEATEIVILANSPTDGAVLQSGDYLRISGLCDYLKHRMFKDADVATPRAT